MTTIKRRRCKICGLPTTLVALPYRGPRWAHRAGDRVRHDRAVAAIAMYAEREARRVEK